jgi:hypothetical protein
MPIPRAPLAGLAFACFAAFTAQAAPAALNLHPGLWEMTTSGVASGALPIPDDMLARLPPDRRAKMEAAMAASRARAAAPHTFKQCITKDSLQHGLKVDDSKNGQSCRPTVVSSTASVMDMRLECKSPKQTTSGTFHFEAASPKSLAGTITMTIGDGVHTMTVNRIIQGKWLGDDCGGAKSVGQ